MLKKRIVGVIPIRNGIAVQSFRYNSYLPLGDPLIIAENLDRWGIDEILLHNIDRTKKKLGPDIILLESTQEA
jgi:cyclase